MSAAFQPSPFAVLGAPRGRVRHGELFGPFGDPDAKRSCAVLCAQVAAGSFDVALTALAQAPDGAELGDLDHYAQVLSGRLAGAAVMASAPLARHLTGLAYALGVIGELAELRELVQRVAARRVEHDVLGTVVSDRAVMSEAALRAAASEQAWEVAVALVGASAHKHARLRDVVGAASDAVQHFDGTRPESLLDASHWQDAACRYAPAVADGTDAAAVLAVRRALLAELDARASHELCHRFALTERFDVPGA